MNGETKNKMKRKRSLWTEQTESAFIEMWADKIEDLRGKRKKSHVYKEMAAELAKNDLKISPAEVKAKITNLTTKFRKCKSCIGPFGESPYNWPLYERISRIIGSQPIHNLEGITEDSIIYVQDSQSGDMDVTEMVSGGETAQSLTPSLNMSPRLSSADKPTSSAGGATNKQLVKMFEKFGNAFEQAISEDKKCTEEFLALEREKIKIFKNISDSTEKLASSIIDFLKNMDKKDI